MLYRVFFHGEEGANPLTWTWEPSVLIGLALITLGYLALTGPIWQRKDWGAPVSWQRKIVFLLGNLVVFFALVSPLDHIADEYLFSAHMVQHLLLFQVAPVLWLLGLPDGLLVRLIRPQWARRLLGLVTQPVVAFAVLTGVMLVWHIPALYAQALESEQVHIFQHLTFMAAGVIGWWPVFGRFEQAAPRAPMPIQLMYVFLMMFPSTALAAWLTLTPGVQYPFYEHAPRLWGLTPHDDQQLGGLIMWIPGNMLGFALFASIFFRWFRQREPELGISEE